MAKTTVSLSGAKLAQLKEYAVGTLGLDVNQGMSAAEIRSQIMLAAPDVKEITVTDIADDKPKKPAQEKVAQPKVSAPAEQKRTKPVQLIDNESEQSGRNDAIATIFIQVGTGKSGKDPVFVGVNGTSILIPRGEEARVPYRYYDTLSKATRIEYDQETDVQGRPGVLVPRLVPEYPVSLIGITPASEAEAA